MDDTLPGGADSPVLLRTAVPPEVGAAQRGHLARQGWGMGGTAEIPVASLFGRVLAGRAARALSAHGDALWFGTDEWGKPGCWMPDGRPGPAFSLAHAGRHVMVAAGPPGQLGVDIERTRPVPPGLPGRILAPADARRVEASGAGGAAEFARLWTVIEACGKATGEGLAVLRGGPGPLGAGAAGRWRGLSWACGVLGADHQYHYAVAAPENETARRCVVSVTYIAPGCLTDAACPAAVGCP